MSSESVAAANAVRRNAGGSRERSVAGANGTPPRPAAKGQSEERGEPPADLFKVPADYRWRGTTFLIGAPGPIRRCSA